MRVRVAAHRVPLGHHPAHQVGLRGDVIAYQKKGRGGAMRLERVQNGLCVAVLKAGVKGQVDHGLARVADVPGVVAG